MLSVTRQPSVFISYRRDDSAGWAGRLEDDLADRLGPSHVFRDVAVPAGVDYEEYIEGVLDSCHVVIVVIGPGWVSSTGADGTPRLAHPDDLLRREIERALQRTDVIVVPVLVQGATMPAAHELPAGLRELARRQALELSDGRWRHDVTRLIAQLRGVVQDDPSLIALAPDEAAHDHATTGPRPGASPGSNRDRANAVLMMVAAAGLGVLIAAVLLADVATLGAGDQADRVAQAAIAWAIIGALVCAAAAATLPGLRANPVGWAILGLFNGAVAGGLSGLTYIALEDGPMSGSEHLLPGAATCIAGVVLGLALAKRVDGERWAYALAGLLGGLIGGTLAATGAIAAPDPALGAALLATGLTVGALALVAAGAAGGLGLRRAAPKP